VATNTTMMEAAVSTMVWPVLLVASAVVVVRWKGGLWGIPTHA
jgi:hypothetical protein